MATTITQQITAEKNAFVYMLLFSLLAIGCGETTLISDNRLSDSEPLHTPGLISRAPLPWLFQEISFAELQSLLPASDRTDERWLPEADPAVTYARTWLTRIWESAKKHAPDRLNGIPKPQAYVLREPSLNAFVSRKASCWNVPIRTESATAGQIEETTKELQLSVSETDFTLTDKGECIPEPVNDATLHDFATFISDNHPTCHITWTGTQLTLHAGCRIFNREGDNVPNVNVEKLHFYRTTNAIVIHEGSAEKLSSEAQFAMLLAHELSHYVLAHATSGWGGFDYFYRIGDTNSPTRPQPDSTLEPLGKHLLQWGHRRKPLPPVVGQQLRTELYRVVVQTGPRVLQGLCATQPLATCDDECSAYTSFMKSNGNSLALFPWSEVNTHTESLYVEAESHFLACAQRIKATPESGEVLWRSVFKHWNTAPVDDILAQAARRTPPTSIAEWAHHSSQTLAAIDAEWDKILAMAKHARIGLYSAEQEADELALELLSIAGVDARDAADLAFALIDSEETSGAHTWETGVIDSATCRAYASQDWKDADGSPIFIPFGRWSDPAHHHSGCFRAWNIWREISVHGW